MGVVYKSYADLHFFQSLKYTRIKLILDPSGMCWVGSYLLCLITALCTHAADDGGPHNTSDPTSTAATIRQRKFPTDTVK